MRGHIAGEQLGAGFEAWAVCPPKLFPPSSLEGRAVLSDPEQAWVVKGFVIGEVTGNGPTNLPLPSHSPRNPTGGEGQKGQCDACRRLSFPNLRAAAPLTRVEPSL